MIIKNKTNQIQEISVMTRDNLSLHYSIYVKAKGEVDIDDGLVVINLNTLVQKGIISVVNAVVPAPVETPVEEVVVEENVTEDIPEESTEVVVEISEVEEVIMEFPEVEETVTEVEESEGKILCDVCGKEFASQRSLTMHINKAHKE